MAQLSEIARLEQRRGLLVAESDRYRQQIAGEVVHLQRAATWTERGYALFRHLRSSWPLIAALAGFVIARRRRSVFRTVRKGWSWWRLLKTLARLWTAFR